MTQRDDMFKLVEETCLELATDDNHPSRADIITHTNRIMAERERLFRLWKLKSQLLDAELACHEFYRDVLKTTATVASHETQLTKAFNDFQLQLDSGVTANRAHVPFTEHFSVEAVESVQKAHDNLTRKIERQSLVKLDELHKRVAVLVEAEQARLEFDEQRSLFPDVNELPKLNETGNELIRRSHALKALCAKRAAQLRDALTFLQLKRDVDEFLTWIGDQIGSKSDRISTSSAQLGLAEQKRLFQEQKALTAAIEASGARHAELAKRAHDHIVRNSTVRAQYGKQQLDELNKSWQNLNCEAAERGKQLAEARDLLEFGDELERLETWLQETELMLSSGEVGTDYEHCESLIKRADEALAPHHEQKLVATLALGDKLVKLGDQSELNLLDEKKSGVRDRFLRVRTGVLSYKQRLSAALECHAFTRDQDELRARIAAKANLLAHSDTTDHLLRTRDAVQTAQSKLGDLERDLTAIGDKLAALSGEARRLDLLNTVGDVEREWRELGELLARRKQRLESARAHTAFAAEYQELSAWLVDMHTRVHTQPEPVSLAEAERALDLHRERRAELAGKEARFRQLSASTANAADQDTVQRLGELEDMHHQLRVSCDGEKLAHYEQCVEYEELREQWRQLSDSWLRSVEQTLRSTELGDSVASVRGLLAKHEAAESSVRSQTQPGAAFDSLEQRAGDMLKKQQSSTTSTHAAQLAALIIEWQQKRKELHRLVL
jgi:spectrin beta